MAASSTSKIHVVRREVCPKTADAIRLRLAHARSAGLLDSYDGRSLIYDGTEVTIVISPENMHPSQRGNFACERAIVDLLVNRSIALHAADSIPPPPDTERP